MPGDVFIACDSNLVLWKTRSGYGFGVLFGFLDALVGMVIWWWIFSSVLVLLVLILSKLL